jgi:hypothetical protein
MFVWGEMFVSGHRKVCTPLQRVALVVVQPWAHPRTTGPNGNTTIACANTKLTCVHRPRRYRVTVLTSLPTHLSSVKVSTVGGIAFAFRPFHCGGLCEAISVVGGVDM